MANQSYHNPHSKHERELADTVARETVEILYGPEYQPRRRGCALAILATAVAVASLAIVLGWWLL